MLRWRYETEDIGVFGGDDVDLDGDGGVDAGIS